jgi:hypothetical protein
MLGQTREILTVGTSSYSTWTAETRNYFGRLVRWLGNTILVNWHILDDKKKVHLTFSIYCLLMDPAYL